MVDGRLTNYIQQQLHAGFSLEVIRNALLQGGYPAQEIDAAIQYIQQATKNAPLQQQTQFDQQEHMLVNYIRQYMKQGYSLQQIEKFLLQNRYPLFMVQKAIADAQSQEKKGFSLPSFSLPSSKSVFIVFFILLIVGAVIGTAWFFLNTTTAEEKPVDFSVTLDIDTVAPAGTLYINNDFINFPSKRAYPITLYYTINEKETLTRVDSWQLSFGINDALKNEKHTILRTIAPKDYELDVKMSYGSTSKQTQVDFTVSANEQEIAAAQKTETEMQTTQETTTETTKETQISSAEISQEKEEIQDTSAATEAVVENIEPFATGSDDYVNYNTAKELAVTDAASATQYCEFVISATKKDECYWAVAKASADKSYCTTIVADNTRDACWIGFAFDKNDYTVCDEIANPFIKQSCEQLEKVNELKSQQITG